MPRITSLPLFAALLALAGCNGNDDTGEAPDPYDVPIGPYDTTIRWTSYGIPHVSAEDYGSAGFGLGYAFAQDHICTLADLIIKVRGERARWFGPGEGDRNIDSDYGWKHLRVYEYAEQGFFGFPQDYQDLVVGYTAGYNEYLAEVGPAGLPEPCRDAEWVQPINHIDLVAYHLHLGQFASGYPLVNVIAQAQPPDARRDAAPRAEPPPLELFDYFLDPPLGSNGWAVGSTKSANGKGMLVSNTHFPTEGERRWHEFHLTIGEDWNSYGVALLGVPMPNMGFNEHIAWTHTVSNTPRFVMYRLDLKSDDPTQYRFDGNWRQMEGTSYTIQIKQPDGSLTDDSRTLYRSHYGPIFNAPLVGWSNLQAFTYRDANENNPEMTNTWFFMNKATDLDSFKAAHRDYQGIPWVHTLMTNPEGNAYYTDSAVTPNLSPAAYEAYEELLASDFFVQTFAASGVMLVEGDDPLYTWVEDDRAARSGTIPFDDNPQLLRDDFVANANQNYWATNPAEPLTGFPGIYGPEQEPLTPRTKMNLTFLTETDGASGADGKFDLDELEAAVLSTRGNLAETLRAQVVTRCTGAAPITLNFDGSPKTVDLTEACAVLAGWDSRSTISSVGPALWREFVLAEDFAYEDLGTKGKLFGDDFDPANPITTPNTLAPPPTTGDDKILVALARAVATLETAGFAIDAPLGDLQFRVKGDHTIPTPGGTYSEGLMSIATWLGGNTSLIPANTRPAVLHERTGLTEGGYFVNNGNSFVMLLRFTDDGPEARGILTYSQTEYADSPHFEDQTLLYKDLQTRPILFTEAQIAADPNLVEKVLTHPGG